MIRKKPSFKKAFSLLELVFVIVILGIVSSIGAEIISKVYGQYIIQRAQHRASLKTELAATQIANRLRYAIRGTVFRIKNDNSLESIESAFGGDGDDYVGLQWVAYDGDSFEALNTTAGREPGWSGFCDLDASSKNTIKTLGSKLSLTDDIIKNLSKNTDQKDITDTTVFFPYNDIAHNVTGRNGDDEITLVDVTSRTLAEQYRLAWSSYALKVENGDLYLYYNFSPSPAAALGNTKSLLLKNISTFKFKGTGGSIRFKICKEESIGEDFNITACKEKVAL